MKKVFMPVCKSLALIYRSSCSYLLWRRNCFSLSASINCVIFRSIQPVRWIIISAHVELLSKHNSHAREGGSFYENLKLLCALTKRCVKGFSFFRWTGVLNNLGDMEKLNEACTKTTWWINKLLLYICIGASPIKFMINFFLPLSPFIFYPP